MDCRCKTCKNLKMTKDKRNWVRYSCPFAPDIEFLGSVQDHELKEGCLDYKARLVIKSEEEE